MVKAFVFGKFLPFHKGHEAMIRFALTHCDSLSVLVCSSNMETIPGNLRKQWIEETFSGIPNIHVIVFDYREEDLPNTSESSETVSQLWSQKFLELITGHNLLITSEPYGDMVARYMNIRHISFDPARQAIPVSSTMVRNSLFENWNFLCNSVKPYYVKKVVILGTESTGKTTLGTRLAHHFQCTLVPETGRDLIPNSNTFSFEDLEAVAQAHALSIQHAEKGESPLVIIDTDIHITMSYARFVFSKPLPVTSSMMEANKAHLYLYLKNDVPFVQDGTRLPESHRNQLDLSHRRILAENYINYVEIGGGWEERLETAVRVIKSEFGM